MTKFRIASDLHLEFYQYKIPMSLNGRDMEDTYQLPIMEGEDEQILILAGDVLTAKNCWKAKPYFDAWSKRFKQIIVIMGNHEHYDYNFNRTRITLEEFYAEWPNVTFLENDTIFIDDIAIFGGTLWTNFNQADPMSMMVARHGMPDFRGYIGFSDEEQETHTPGPVFTPELSIQQWVKCQKALWEFAKLPNEKKIVITHHLPSFLSVHQRFKMDALSYAFFSHMDEQVEKLGANLWVHGHTHNSFDYEIGKTRVLCNPFGYWSENTKEYNGKLVVDI